MKRKCTLLHPSDDTLAYIYQFVCECTYICINNVYTTRIYNNVMRIGVIREVKIKIFGGLIL